MRIGGKRKWWLLVPFLAVSAGTMVVSMYLPNRYRSEALIQIVPQRVPEAYVRSTVSETVEERLQSMGLQVLSSTKLEKVIRDLNLYPGERRRWPMEDVIERMRREISIQISRQTSGERVISSGFRLSFTADDPRTAQEVANQLAGFYINENSLDRQALANDTNQFLEAQLADARTRLEQQEKALEAFRRTNSGELPTQVQANMQALQNLQLQIQAQVESVARDRDRRLMLERLKDDFESQDAAARAATPPEAVAGTPDQVPGGTTAAQLEAARASLRALQLKFTPEHPDVQRMARTVKDLEKKAEAEALARPLSPVGQPATPLSRDAEERRSRLANMGAQIESLDRQIAFKEGEEKRLRNLAASYQGRIDAVPRLESQWTVLTRDYATLEETYKSLLAKSEASKLSANLERRAIGEQFRLLDAPKVPERPISPNRPLINGVGALAGLSLGLVIVGLLEYRDTSFHTGDDVAVVLELPVLATIPVMLNASERKRRTRRRVGLWLGGVATVLVAAAAIVWKLELWKQL